MIWTSKSQVRALMIVISLLVLLSGLVLAASFTFDPDQSSVSLQMNETDSAINLYDANVSVDELLVDYGLTLFAGENLNDYLSINQNTGVLTVNLPRFYLGTSMSENYPDGTSFIVAENVSDSSDKEFLSFTIDIFNVNEPPLVLECSPRIGTTGCVTDNFDRSENQSYVFNVTYEDLDPGNWSDVDATWYLQFDGGTPQALTGSEVLGVNNSCSSITNFTSCVLNFSLNSAGPFNLTAVLEDQSTVGAQGLQTNVTWNFSVLNVNQKPYFTANETVPSAIGTYNGWPLLNITELENVIIRVNYTDNDSVGDNLEYESYEVDAFFYIDDSQNTTDQDLDEYSEFYFNTTLETVLGGLNHSLFELNITITDGGLTDYALWYVNVSNLDAQPTIDGLRHTNGTETTVNVDENNTVSAYEGDTSTFAFDYSDLDNNLDTAVISVDGTPIFTENPSNKESDTSTTTRTWNFEEAGTYNVSFFINDTQGLSNTSWYFVEVINNTAPQIDSFTILNSTGGSDFFEGGDITITVTYSDNESNAGSTQNDYYIKINGKNVTDITTGSNTFSKQFTWNYTSSGTYNISAQMFDDGGLSSQIVFDDTIFVNYTEIAPEVDFMMYDNTSEQSSVYPYSAPYSTNGQIFSWEGEQVSFNAEFFDRNGNDTIDTIEIRSDGNLIGSPETNNRDIIRNYNLQFEDSGTKNITFFVNDTEGNNITEWFELVVENNTAPNITSFFIHNGTDEITEFEENSSVYVNFTYEDSFYTSDLRNMGTPYVRLYQGNTIFDTITLSRIGLTPSYEGQYFFDFGDYSDYNITFFINDTQGLFDIEPNNSISVSFDNQAPTIDSINISFANETQLSYVESGDQFFIEESNGNIGLNNYTIEFSASDLNGDLNVSSAQIIVNGTPYDGFSHSEFLDFDSQGNYIVNITILDNLGNSANSFLNITVNDNVDPVISDIDIRTSSGDVFIEETDTVRFIVEADDDNNNIKNYSLAFNDSSKFANSSNQSSNTFNGFTTTYDDYAGDYNVTATVIDLEGRTHTFSKVFTVVYKNQSPVIETFNIDSSDALSASSIKVFEGKDVNLFVEASDNDSDLNSLEFFYEGNPISGCLKNPVADTTFDSFGCTWLPGDSTAGPARSITVSAIDSDGLVKNESYLVEVQENTIPVVENLSIVNSITGEFNFTEGDDMNISFDYYDLNENYDAVQIIINTDPVTIINDSNATVYWDFDSRGTYNITAFVNDTFGESAQLSNTTVVIKKREFVPQIVDITVTERNTTEYQISPGDNISVFPNFGKLNNELDIEFNATDQNGYETITDFNISVGSVVDVNQNNYLWELDFPLSGYYQVNVSATDQDGKINITSFYINVTENRDPFVITNTTLNSSGLPELYENDIINFSFNVSDLDGNIDTLLIYFNDSVIASTSSDTYLEHVIPLSYTDRGVYDVWFFVNDTAGVAVNNSDTVEVLPTNISPLIDSYDVVFLNETTFTSPTSIDLRENQEFTVRFSASDVNEDIKNLSIYYNDALRNTTSALNSLNWTYRTSFSDQGIFVMNLTVFDNNDEFDFREITFNVTDNERPVIDSINVTNQTMGYDLYEGGLHTIKVNATDSYNNIVNLTVLREFNNSGVKEQVCFNDTFVDNNFVCTALWQTNFSDRGEYNISAIAYDVEGLASEIDSNIFPIKIVNRTPIIISTEFAQDNGAYSSVAQGETVTINETDNFSIRISQRDENGNSTLDSINFSIIGLNESFVSPISTTESANFTTDYFSQGTYVVNVTVTDKDGLSNSSTFELVVRDNIPSTFTNFDVRSQTDSNTTFNEGDTITVTVNTTDTFNNGKNISIYRNTTLLGACDDINCSAVWDVNFTASGDYLIQAFVQDDQGLINQTNRTITVGGVPNAPFFREFNITSRYKDITYVINESNITCTSDLNTGRTCEAFVDLNFSEGDTLDISFIAYDLNGNDTLRSQRYAAQASLIDDSFITISTLTESGTTVYSGSIPFDQYESGSSESSPGAYQFNVRASDETLDTNLYINFTVADNTRPTIDSYNITNGTGQEGYYEEGDLLNITYQSSDADLNIDTREITIGGTSYSGNQTVFNLNYSSFGDYEICFNSTDEQPLSNILNCTTITVHPINVSPSISRIQVNNGTWNTINSTDGVDIINLLEGNELLFDIDASDLNGNETINYTIARNGSKTPLIIGNTSDFSFDFNFSQSGFYNISINLTTDREDELVREWFLLDVEDNIGPVIDFYNVTSNQSNLSERNFVEGNTVYLNFSFEDVNQNNETHYIRYVNSEGRNVTNHTTFWAYEFPFGENTGGKSIEYNITFFVNDSEGIIAKETDSFIVQPKPTAPVITNPLLLISNGTNVSITNNSLITVFENQNFTVTFNATDVNGDIESYKIFNSTQYVPGNTTTLNTTYDTATSQFTPFSYEFFVNDSSGKNATWNFTLNLRNNTAGIISNEEINSFEPEGQYAENQTLIFDFDMTDPDQNLNYANITIEKQNVGVFNEIVNFSESFSPSSSYSLSHFFESGVDRGTYRYNFTIKDDDGEINWTTHVFSIDGDNFPPIIENITVNRSLFDNVSVDPDSTIQSQEGDQLSISFDSYDIDDGDSVISTTIEILTVPDGLSILNNASSGNEGFISWNPNFTQSGLYEVRLSAFDGDLNGREKFFINVTDNIAPNITSFTISNDTTQTVNFTENQTAQISFTVSDPNLFPNIDSVILYENNDPIYTTNTSGSTTRYFNFTDEGIYNFTLYVNDTGGLEATNESIVVNVTANEVAPNIVSIQTNNGTGLVLTQSGSRVTMLENRTFIVNVSAYDNNTDDSLNYNISRDTTSFGSTTSIQNWTPGWYNEGVYNITVNVSDNNNGWDLEWFELEVINNTGPNITDWNISDDTDTYYPGPFFENSTLYFNFTYDDPYGFVSDGGFEQITIDGNSVSQTNTSIRYEFGEEGLYYYEYYVQDKQGLNDTHSGNFTINASQRFPEIIVATIDNGTGAVSVQNDETYSAFEGIQTVSFFFNATDVNEDIDTERIYNGTEWLNTNDTSQLYPFGTDGLYTIIYWVNDSLGQSVNKTFNLSIINNTPPFLVDDIIQNTSFGNIFYEGEEINVTFTYDDNQSNIDTAVMSFQGVNYTGDQNSITELLPLNLTSSGDYNISLFINDTEGRNYTNDFAVTVNDTIINPVIDSVTFVYQSNTVDALQYNESSNPYSIPEQKQLNILVSASDLNTDEELNYTISINTSPSIQRNTNEYLWTTRSDDVGLRNITIFVEDELGGNTSKTLYVNVTPNAKPDIILFNITNTSDGLTLSEGNPFILDYEITDADNNLVFVELLLNDSVFESYTTNAYSKSDESLMLNYTSRGFKNFTLRATDSEGSVTNSTSLIRFINATEIAPQITSMTVFELNGTEHNLNENDTLTIKQNYLKDTNVLNISFNASDINGNDTLVNPQITVNSNTTNAYVTQWDINYSLEGLYRVNISVNDTSGLTNQTYFYVNITPNSAPQIDFSGWFNSTGGTQIYENDSITLNLNASDIDQNIEQVRIEFNNSIKNQSMVLTNLSYTQNLSFTDRGLYNVTFYVIDYAGNVTENKTNVTVQPVDVDPVIVNYTVRLSNGSNFTNPTYVSIPENRNVSFEFEVFDVNQDINTSSYNISRNGNIMNDSLVWTWQTGYDDSDIYSINFSVMDNAMGIDWKNMTFEVLNNTLPSIDYINITNSTEGFDLYENDTLTIYANASDEYDEILYIEIQRNSDVICTNSSFECSVNWTPSFTDRGEYNITVFTYDINGTTVNRTEEFTVNPTDLKPVISDVSINVSNETYYENIQNDTIISIFEGQNISVNFSVFDINENIKNISLFNGTSTVFNSTNFTINSTFDQTNAENISYDISLFANDTSDKYTYFNFTLVVINNTKPNITTYDVLGEIYEDATRNIYGFEEGNNLTFNLSYIDYELNAERANITIYRNVSNSWVLINTTQQTAYNPFIFEQYFPVTQRGMYKAQYLVYDAQGLVDEKNKTFNITGPNLAPFVTNISVNSSYFGFSFLNETDVFNTQEGDELIISFDAYDIDIGDSPDENTMRVTLVNSSTNNSLGIFSNVLQPATWSINFSESGYYGVRLRVSDESEGASRNVYFYANVTDNLRPYVNSTYIGNTTTQKAGFNEGEDMVLNFTVSDFNEFDNIDQTIIYLNGTNISHSLNHVYTWNYSSEGTYNVTFFVNDTGGEENQTEHIITINPTEVSPQITQIRVNNGSGYVNVGEGNTTPTFENENLLIRINVSDLNEDANFTYTIRNNDSSDIDDINDGEFSWDLGWFNQGIWNISINVTDDTNRNDSTWFMLDITDNKRPNITYYNITNSTSDGLFDAVYYENDSVYLNFTYEDENTVSANITFNGTSVDFGDAGQGDVSYFFEFTQAGVYPYDFRVIDEQGLFDNRTGNITILEAVQAPFIFNATFDNGTMITVEDGSQVIMQENSYANLSFLYDDLNGIDDIRTVYIYNGSEEVSGNFTVFNTGWFSEGIHNIVYFVNDSSDFSSQIDFTINVTNNTEPYLDDFAIFDQDNNETLNENDTVTINFTITDNQSNMLNWTVYLDDTVLATNATIPPVFFNKTLSLNASKYFNFTSSGFYNITFYAQDEQGLELNHTEEIQIIDDREPPQIISTQLRYDGDVIAADNYDTIQVLENKPLRFVFTATDLNTDENVTMNVTVNMTPLNFSTTETFSPGVAFTKTHDWTFPFGQSGMREMVALVTDELGESANFTLYFNVTPNTRPRFINFEVTNDTGGTYFAEGSNYTVNYTITDDENNMESVILYQNITQITSFNPSNTEGTYEGTFNLSSRGTYLFWMNISDDGGLWNNSNQTITVNATEVDPVIDDVLIKKSISDPTGTLYSTGATIFTLPGDNVSFNASGSDANADTQLTFRIARNETNVSFTNYYEFAFDASMSNQNITIYLNDSTGREVNMSFEVINGTDTAPQVSEPIINDSITGSNIFENRSIDITIPIIDSNLKNITIYYDGEIIEQETISSPLPNNQYETTYFIPFKENGLRNISALVHDYGGFNSTNVTEFTVEKTESAPRITSVIALADNSQIFSPSENDTIMSFEGDSIQITFSAFDDNGDIANYTAYRNGTPFGTNNTIWDVNYTATDYYNITLQVNDTDGLSDNFTFFINITPNEKPTIDELVIKDDSNTVVYNSTSGVNVPIVANTTLTVQTYASDREEQPLTYSALYDGSQVGTNQTSTFTIPSTDIGEFNVSVFVSDEEFTVNTSVMLNITELEVPPVLEFISVNSPNIEQENIVPNGSQITITAGDTLNLTAIASDNNGDLNYSKTLFEFKQGTGAARADYTGRTASWLLGFNEVGYYQVITTVEDNLSATNTGNIYVNVTPNLDPSIISFNVTNSSGQSGTFIEGDYLNISVNFTNILAQYGTFTIEVNNQTISSSRAEDGLTATYPLSFDSRGDYVISAAVTDGKGASASYSDTVTVVENERDPQIYANMTYMNGTVQNVFDGNTLFAEESAGSMLNVLTLNYDVIDPNGNDTLDTNYFRMNGEEKDKLMLNYSSQGSYNVSIYANDTTSRETWLNFTITVRNNTPPSVSATFTNETGGSDYTQGEKLNVTAIINDTNNNLANVTLTLNNITQVFTNQSSMYSSLVDLTPYSNESVDVRIKAYDYEGLLNETNETIYVNATPVDPVISQVSLTTNEATFNVTDNETITLYPNASASLTISGFDANNEKISLNITSSNVSTTSTSLSQTLYPGQEFNISTWIQSLLFNETQLVEFKINVTNDNSFGSLSLTPISIKTFTFYVNVTPNVAPVINSVEIVNSDGDNTSYIEGDTLSVDINVTDENNNLVSINSYSNKTILARILSNNIYVDQNYTWELNESTTSFNIPLRGFFAPNITLNITATDSLGETDTVMRTLNITPVSYDPTIVNATASTPSNKETVSEGLLLAAFSPGNKVDLEFAVEDDDLDVDFVSISINDDVYNGTKKTFTVAPNSIGNIYNITYFVNDSRGVSTELSYKLRIVKATEVEVQSPASGSSSSSGSGSSSSSQPVPSRTPDIEITNPRPIVISQNQVIGDIVYIRNTGQSQLYNISIIPQFDKEGFEIEFLDSIESLDTNQTVAVGVRYNNSGTIDPFEVTFTVEGRDLRGNTVTTDNAVLYVNSLASDFTDNFNDDYRSLLEYVRTLVLDNVDCLGLVDLVSRGEQAYQNGNTPLAMDYLRTARDDCLNIDSRTARSINTNILERDSSVQRLILQILAIVFILLLIPSVYIYYKKHKGRKKGDSQEQEIERLLDEFYDR